MRRDICNRKLFARRIREARGACNRVEPQLKPLCKHLIKLAVSDLVSARREVKAGTAKTKHHWASYRCQRAGRELAAAKKLAEKHPRR